MKINIGDKASLASIRVSSWSGTKTDKDVSNEVAATHMSDPKSSRVIKVMLDRKLTKAITTAGMRIRKEFEKRTLPWEAGGSARLLPHVGMGEFISCMASHVQDFNQAVNDFIANGYDDALESAKERLGTMFNADEFPSQDDLQRMYLAEYRITPIGDYSMFSGILGDSLVEQLEQGMKADVTNGLRDLFDRLHGKVAHAVDVLSKEDSRIHKSLLDNMASIVEEVSALNIWNDKGVADACQKVVALATLTSVDGIRNDRAAFAAEAAKVKAEIDMLLNGLV